MFTRGWKEVGGHTGVYVYCGAPDSVYKVLGDRCIASYDTAAYYDVFTHFKVKGDVDSGTLAMYNNAQIKITAYAVQADGFEDTKKITDAELWKTAFPTADADPTT